MNVTLSERQRTILHHLTEGLTNEEMARRMFLSPHTTRIYRTQLLEILGARSAAQAVHNAYQLGVLSVG